MKKKIINVIKLLKLLIIYKCSWMLTHTQTTRIISLNKRKYNKCSNLISQKCKLFKSKEGKKSRL